ncbi:MAG: alpha/beta fold hydrolase [Bacteroidales bacterium]|nr:alpha/beta fold hydrolase [Bacteroidales bacterium]
MISIFSRMFKKNNQFRVYGEQGGISTAITLPDGFNPESDKCPMAILMHGFMSSKRLYPIPRIAKELARLGIGSISFDFNAHGKSEGKFIDMTIANEISDAKAVFDYVCTLPYVTEVAFVGHSQGGVIAGMLAGQLEDESRKPLCMVQMAPAAVLKDDAIAGQCMNAKYDPVNPPEYVNVMFHKLGRTFIMAAQQLPIYETSSRYTGKVCLIHGKDDKIVPFSYGEKYHELYKNSDLHLIEGEGHMMRNKKEEIVGIVTTFLKENLK